MTREAIGLGGMGASAEGPDDPDHRSLHGVSTAVLWYLGSEVVARFASIVALSRVLDPETFAAFVVINAGAALVQGVLLLGGDSALLRYYLLEPTRAGRGILAATLVTAIFGLSVIGAVLLVGPLGDYTTSFIMGGVDRHASAVMVAILTAPIVLANRLMGQVLKNEERSKSYSLTGLATATVGIACAIVLYEFVETDARSVFIGLAFGEIVGLMFRGYLGRRFVALRFEVVRLPRLLRYGLPLVPASAGYWAVASADRILIVRYEGLLAAGGYAIAVSLTAPLLMLSGAVAQAFTPRALSIFADDPSAAPDLYGRVLQWTIGLIGSAAIILTGLAPIFVRVIAPEEYSGSVAIVGWLAAAVVLSGSAAVTSLSLVIAQQSSRIALGAILAAALNVVLNVVLIPKHGTSGAAAATFVAYAFLSTQYLWVGRRTLVPAHLSKSLVVLLVACAGCLFAQLAVTRSPAAWASLATACLATLMLMVYLDWRGQTAGAGSSRRSN